MQVSKDGKNFSEEVVTFHHVDGMYSLCTVDGWPENEASAHLTAFARLKKEGDFWVLEEEQLKDEEDLPTQEEKRNQDNNERSS